MKKTNDIWKAITLDRGIPGKIWYFLRLLNPKFRSATRDTRLLWRMLDAFDDIPMVPVRKRNNLRKFVLYPSFALGILGILAGIYLGIHKMSYFDYIEVTQEVFLYEK